MSVTVLKLGGSLLDLADLPARLRTVLSQVDRPLLISGGGDAANLVRRWHDEFGLDDERSHWLALEAIRLNQRLLLDLMPELELVSNRAAAESARQRGRTPLLDLMAFVGIEEAQSVGQVFDRLGQIASDARQVENLRHDWNVTSDSLAGWVAIRWPADRFVLLKSVPLPSGNSANELAANELVDSHFPKLAPLLPPTEWCDVRGDGGFTRLQ